MLQKVEVITKTGAVLELPIASSPGGYVVKNVDGLDPTKATFASTIIASMDGEEYQAGRGEKRTIPIQLGYSLSHPDSVRARRVNLYKYLMPKTDVTLRFHMTDFPLVEILAHVEDLNAPQFTKDPKVDITLVAFKPDFIAVALTSISGATTGGTEGQTVSYGGSVPWGFLFKMTANRAISGFTINHNLANGEGGVLTVNTPIQVGDLIEINTQDREKGGWLTRAGVRKSILFAIAPASEYIQLEPGNNTLRVFVAGNPIPFTIEYRERFGGL